MGVDDFDLGQATGRELSGVRGVPNIFDAQKLLQGCRGVDQVDDAHKTLGEKTQVAGTRRRMGFGNQPTSNGTCVRRFCGDGRASNKYRANVTKPRRQRDSTHGIDGLAAEIFIGTR